MAHMVSSLVYPNLLGTKRLGCCLWQSIIATLTFETTCTFGCIFALSTLVIFGDACSGLIFKIDVTPKSVVQCSPTYTHFVFTFQKSVFVHILKRYWIIPYI
jgi:hypothetical protein